MNALKRFQAYFFEPDVTSYANQLLSSTTAGLVTSGLQMFLCISYASIIFTGPLSNHLHAGIGYLLMGSIVCCLVTALLSSNRGAVGIPQDAPVVILALMAFEIASEMTDGATGFVSESGFITVVMAIMLTTILTGVVLWVFGRFKLGGFVRFIPYPVVGGFLAGTGWLITRASLSVLTNEPLTLDHAAHYFEADQLMIWLPALIFGLVLLFVSRRFKHELVMPILIFIGILAFHLLLAISGISLEDAQSQRWLLGPFPDSGIFQPITPNDLNLVNWQMLADHHPIHISTIIVLSLVAVLLNASGIELSTKKHIRLNQELKTAGSANVLAGLFAGPVGFPSMSMTILSHKLRARSRLVGLVVALVTVVSLMWGDVLFSLLPRPIIGGLLFFVGLSMILEWVYDGWRRLSKLDYALVWVILLIVAIYGIEFGLLAGLVLAVLLFIVRYSRTNPIYSSFSGETIHSTSERGEAQAQVLRQQGGQIHIYKLQGFLFFGTSHLILSRILARINDKQKESLRYLILDFSRVPDMDSSSEASFVKIAQHTDNAGVQLYVTGLSSSLKQKLILVLADDEELDSIRMLNTLDDALHHCEDDVLTQAGVVAHSSTQFDEEFTRAFGDAALVERLKSHLKTVKVIAGETVVRYGDPADSVFFLLDGELEVLLDITENPALRMRVMQPGAIFGELAIYLDEGRLATIKATLDSTLYELKKSTLLDLWSSDPELAERLNHYLLQTMAKRLVANNRTIENLMR